MPISQLYLARLQCTPARDGPGNRTASTGTRSKPLFRAAEQHITLNLKPRFPLQCVYIIWRPKVVHRKRVFCSDSAYGFPHRFVSRIAGVRSARLTRDTDV